MVVNVCFPEARLARNRRNSVKRFAHSILFAAASLLVLSGAAEAARLETWKFDAKQNRLEFTTDAGVQPKAQLISNPTRLVIDLPGIVLGRPMANQAVGGAFRSIRVGQFDRQTTRIVVELAPGYTIDPNQVRFRGVTAQQWIVQIPTPQPVALGSRPSAPSTPPSVTVTPDQSTAASPSINSKPVNTRPWQQPAPNTPRTSEPAIATIRSVELNGDQLVVAANQPLAYTAAWDRATTAYKITINSAQLPKSVQGPRLTANGPIRQLRLRQEDADTVVLLVQPAAGVQVGQVNQVSQQTLAVQFQRNRPTTPAPNQLGTIPVPSPQIPVAPPPTTPQPTNPLPQIPRGQVVVVVDPGHGGPDPGAVGVGGLQEKGIVLDIGTKVASLLERQGVRAVLTRSNDIDLDLEPRVAMAQRLNATVFVSIHANAISLSRPDVNGLETYYYQSGSELARSIHQSILQSVDIPDRGVRTARFYVLRRTSMPAVLIEVGFVTGRDDAAKLSSDTYRSQMAEAITRGILQYLRQTARF